MKETWRLAVLAGLIGIANAIWEVANEVRAMRIAEQHDREGWTFEKNLSDAQELLNRAERFLQR